jgi:hypothetical protein
MKYMGWSYDQLCQCPEHYLPAIYRHLDREKSEQEEAQREADQRRIH